jgi:hypothetical protein
MEEGTKPIDNNYYPKNLKKTEFEDPTYIEIVIGLGIIGSLVLVVPLMVTLGVKFHY